MSYSKWGGIPGGLFLEGFVWGGGKYPTVHYTLVCEFSVHTINTSSNITFSQSFNITVSIKDINFA